MHKTPRRGLRRCERWRGNWDLAQETFAQAGCVGSGSSRRERECSNEPDKNKNVSFVINAFKMPAFPLPWLPGGVPSSH